MGHDHQDDTDSHLRAFESPTAPFPIGTLGGLSPRQSDPGPPWGEEPTSEPHLVEFSPPTPIPPPRGGAGAPTRPAAPRQVHPMLLALSLLGGGAIALAVVAVIGLLAFLA